MCNCKGKCSCSNVITTSKGPTGPAGPQGPAGANGTNGVLDWSTVDLSCWESANIIEPSATNDEITQALVDTVCETYNAINVTPKAVNDYRTMDQDSIIYIDVINNDNYYPSVTVTITTPPSNGTATIEGDGITIKYIPNSGFHGIEDFGYTITDPSSSTSSATITINVKQVLTSESIETLVLNQITTLLSSNDYWDLAFNIGDKIGISAINLIDFDFSNSFTAGKGKNTGRYKKWAICNGNNGTENLSEGTLRGYNHSNPDYDMGVTGKSGGSDSLSTTLTKGNIPPHRHQYFDSFINAADNSDNFSTDIDNHAASLGVNQGPIYATAIDLQEPAIGDDRDCVWYDRNTGNGTDNINNQDELKAVPDPIISNIRNQYKTVILIQKIV